MHINNLECTKVPLFLNLKAQKRGLCPVQLARVMSSAMSLVRVEPTQRIQPVNRCQAY